MTDTKDSSIQEIIMKKKLMRFILDREIVNYSYYLDTFEQPLNVKIQEVSEKMDLVDKELTTLGHDDNKRREWINLKVESDQIKGFVNLLRQSFITTLYSFMELWILRDCYLDSMRRDGGKSYSKLKKEKGIIKAKYYYVNVLKSNYPFDTNHDWRWINHLRLLRDCIVHRQGSLSGFSDFKINLILKSFVENESGLSLFGTSVNQIIIDHEFCQKSINIIHKFMVEFLSLQMEKE